MYAVGFEVLAEQKHGPNWCDFHKQNHRASTNCPHLKKGPASSNPITKEQAKPKVESGISTEIDEVPDLKDLKYAGDARGIGGAKPKSFFQDAKGKKYLFKPSSSKFRATAQQVASQLTAKLLPKGSYIPVKVTQNETKKQIGSVQPFLDDIVGDLSSANPKKLSPKEKKSIQEERAVDWLISNHDSHGGNLGRRKDGSVIGLDKEQSMKHVGNDKLSTDYHPNAEFHENPPIYNKLYDEYSKGNVDLDLNDVLPVIQRAEATPDSEWESIAKPYVEQWAEATGGDPKKKMQAIIDRKHNARSDFEKFFTDLNKKRGLPPFKFKDQS